MSAMAALQTLASVSQHLTTTEQRVSSGLKVAKASDDAAYWSIATTMRSDKGATSAVADALGVASATVDTAYAGLSSVVDSLSAFKDKLVTAKEGSVDRTKIQAELEQIKQQVSSVADSASFSGVNMLQSDQAENLNDIDTVTTSVPSAFVRGVDGSVSVSDIDVNMTKTILYNTGGGGLLQTDTDALGLNNLAGFVGGSAPHHAGHEDHLFTGPRTFGSSDSINFDLTLDASDYSAGSTYSITIDKSVIDAALGTGAGGKISTSGDMASVLRKAFQLAGAPANSVTVSSTNFDIETTEGTGLVGSSVAISNVTSSFGGSALGLENSPAVSDDDNIYPDVSFDFDKPFGVPDGDSFSFNFAIDGGTQIPVTVDRATVDAALGTTANGVVNSADDMAAVLTQAAQGLGLVATAASGTVTLTVDRAIYPMPGVGLTVSAPQKNTPADVVDFNFADIDITEPGADIDHYLDGLNLMQSRVTSAAATLGALQSRIDLQSSFANSLIDSIDRGVGRLVDADMEDESSKLAAQQTQQQLAVQTLSIANQAPQRLLSLFGG